MEEHLQRLRDYAKKDTLAAREFRDGLISLYLVISRLNQQQGNPDVGLKQEPRGLLGHIHGFMAAIFWERGFDFEDPQIEQIMEIKMMMDGMVQLYAMSEIFQQALNDGYEWLAAKARGKSADVTPAMTDLLGIDAEGNATSTVPREEESVSAPEEMPPQWDDVLESPDLPGQQPEMESTASAAATDELSMPDMFAPPDNVLNFPEEKQEPMSDVLSAIEPPEPETPPTPAPELLWNFEPASEQSQPPVNDDFVVETKSKRRKPTPSAPAQEGDVLEDVDVPAWELASPTPTQEPAPSEAEPISETTPAPGKKKRGRKKAAETEEKPKRRRRGRQQGVKIDLANVQVPDEFMSEVVEEEPEPAPEPALPRIKITETIPETAEVSEPPELLSAYETVTEPEAESTPAEDRLSAEGFEPTNKQDEDEFSLNADILQDPEVEKRASALAQATTEFILNPESTEAEPLSEPADTDRISEDLVKELESIPELESSPSQWDEIKPAAPAPEPDQIPSQPAPVSPRLDEWAPEPPSRGGLVKLLVGVIVGVLLGAGATFYWFGVRVAGQHAAQVQTLQNDLNKTKVELEQAAVSAQAWKQDQQQRQERSAQIPSKPEYMKVGQGVLLYWFESDIQRKYYVYRAKSKASELKKISEKPMSKNMLRLEKVSNGTWYYAVSAVDTQGNETKPSEALKLTFPLRK